MSNFKSRMAISLEKRKNAYIKKKIDMETIKPLALFWIKLPDMSKRASRSCSKLSKSFERLYPSP